jgi:hypothetical protein
MKKRLPIDFSIVEYLVLIFLALASLFYFNGCVTDKALKLAKEKASPENIEYWKIRRVVSAVRQEKGDISICLELEKASKKRESKLLALTIPVAVSTGEIDRYKGFGLRPGECPLSNNLCYWYPVEKAAKRCDKISKGNLSARSILPIERLTVGSQNQLSDLLHSYHQNAQSADKICEVSYASEEVIVIYWPARNDRESVRPIGIAGVYEDKSTNLYYLTLPAAFAGDVVIVAAGVAAFITGIALGTYMSFH